MRVEESINLRQGSTSVKEYPLNFTLLSRYQSLVSNRRDEMSRLVTSVADFEKEESRTVMLHN